jgi:hypothetical protein
LRAAPVAAIVQQTPHASDENQRCRQRRRVGTPPVTHPHAPNKPVSDLLKVLIMIVLGPKQLARTAWSLSRPCPSQPAGVERSKTRCIRTNVSSHTINHCGAKQSSQQNCSRHCAQSYVRMKRVVAGARTTPSSGALAAVPLAGVTLAEDWMPKRLSMKSITINTVQHHRPKIARRGCCWVAQRDTRPAWFISAMLCNASGIMCTLTRDLRVKSVLTENCRIHTVTSASCSDLTIRS